MENMEKLRLIDWDQLTEDVTLRIRLLRTIVDDERQHPAAAKGCRIALEMLCDFVVAVGVETTCDLCGQPQQNSGACCRDCSGKQGLSLSEALE